MDDKILQTLRQFIIDHADSLSIYGFTSGDPTLPHFELYARDYLDFAEEELEQYQTRVDDIKNEKHLINCISHLKRAMDCELDIFLEAFGLLKTFHKRNLKFETKLDFLREAGVFSSRTLSRLNTIRNKMEHEYEIPKILEIEIYFDLVSSFIAVLERTITFSQYSDIEFREDDQKDRLIAWIGFKYDREKPSISATWGAGDNRNGDLTCEANKPNKFAFLLKVFILLLQSERFVSSRYVIQRLDG